MAKNRILQLYETSLLILVWLVLIVSPIFFNSDDNFTWQTFLKPFEITGPLFVIFLLNRFLLVPQFLFKKRTLYYLLSVGGLIALFTVGTLVMLKGSEEALSRPSKLEEMRRPPIDRPGIELNRPGLEPGRPPIRDSRRGGPMPPHADFLIFSILLVGFDTGLRASFRLAESERKKAKLETENVGSQLAFLRTQVSPHFFMNTLNNIHSLIDIDATEAKESVIRLSRLMRHLLYESDIDTIPIRKEVDFIRNYVDLMKLRYSDKVKINLMLPDDIPDKSIPPLLFTSFLDNAFKHGVSYKKDSFIIIAMTIEEKELIFEVRNSLANHEVDDESSGIGIENSTRRLDLIYKDDYQLDIEELSDSYKVKLSIPV